MAKRRKTLSRVFLQLPGRHQPEGASARWKMVPAPADTGGRNAAVPPPLRVVQCAFCNSNLLPARIRATTYWIPQDTQLR